MREKTAAFVLAIVMTICLIGCGVDGTLDEASVSTETVSEKVALGRLNYDKVQDAVYELLDRLKDPDSLTVRGIGVCYIESDPEAGDVIIKFTAANSYGGRTTQYFTYSEKYGCEVNDSNVNYELDETGDGGGYVTYEEIYDGVYKSINYYGNEVLRFMIDLDDYVNQGYTLNY